MPGGDTKRLLVLKALRSVLESITPASDYDFNLSGKVFIGKALFGDELKAPYISIVESDRADEQTQGAGRYRTVRKEKWELLIQGWDKIDSAYPTEDLYRMLGAIEHRLSRVNVRGTDFYRLDGLTGDIEFDPGIVVPFGVGTAGSIECFFLRVRLEFFMSLTDPWNVSRNP